MNDVKQRCKMRTSVLDRAQKAAIRLQKSIEASGEEIRPGAFFRRTLLWHILKQDCHHVGIASCFVGAKRGSDRVDRPYYQHKERTMRELAGGSRTTRGRQRSPGHSPARRYSGACSFWYCSTISPAFVERVTPVASFPFPLPRHTLVDKTLAIDAPTAFFARLRCGQTLGQASHHAGKEAFDNSHGMPSHFQCQAAYDFARFSENLERVVDAIGENVRFGTDGRLHLAARNNRSTANGSVLAVTGASVTCSSRVTTIPSSGATGLACTGSSILHVG
jgi:hypothetical protein